MSEPAQQLDTPSSETIQEKESGEAAKPRFKETVAIMDDKTWIWEIAKSALELSGKNPLRLPSTVPIRHSWNRFKNADRIVIHWESKGRSGGALVEEILDVAPKYAVGEKIIVLTTNPTHEDVVYFSELNIKRIIRIRNRDQERVQAVKDLKFHVTAEPDRDKRERAWRKILTAIDQVPYDPPEQLLAKLDKGIATLIKDPENLTARELDATASMHSARGEDEEAIKIWHKALDKNPNYFRTYHNLIRYYRGKNLLNEAYGLMKKMQELNKSNISRLVSLGEIKMSLTDEERAEFYFKSALEKDNYCSGALNGLAEIRFRQGDLEESRKLLERSALAYKTAAKLNSQGIEMVRRKRYEEALQHYTKAQYVLPQQEKGPRLFYNIGLCYSRWGKLDMAKEFLKIALVKQPDYQKAKRLLDALEEKTTSKIVSLYPTGPSTVLYQSDEEDEN